MGLLTMMCYYMSLFGFSLSPLPCHIRNTLKLALGVYWVEHSVGQFQLDHIGQFQLDVIRQVQLDGAGRGLVLRVTPLPTIDTNLNKVFVQLRKFEADANIKMFQKYLNIEWQMCVFIIVYMFPAWPLGTVAKWEQKHQGTSRTLDTANTKIKVQVKLNQFFYLSDHLHWSVSWNLERTDNFHGWH